MSQTGSITSNIVAGGIQFSSSIIRTAEGQIGHTATIAAGQAGAISAAGVDGLQTGHGIIGTDVVNVHWTVAGELKSRRGLLVDTANANDIEFDETPAGEGDALPAEDTAVVVGVQVVIDSDWDGDLVELIGAVSSGIGVVDFRTAADASLLAVNLLAGEAWTWATQTAVTNPLTGDPVGTIVVSNGAITASSFSCGLVYQSVT